MASTVSSKTKSEETQFSYFCKLRRSYAGVVVNMMGFMAVVGEYFASFLETVVGLSAHLSSPVVTGTLGVVCVTSLVLWVCSCLRRSKDKGEWGVLINDN